MKLFDFFSQANAEYIDQLYRQYQQDPESVDERWSVFFAGFEAGTGSGSVLETLLSSRSGSPAEGVNHLVHSYREFGHLIANLNPLYPPQPTHPLLQLSQFGLAEPEDLSRQVSNGGFLGPYDGTLQGLLNGLRATYCGTIGVEYTDIADKTQREWLQQKMEPTLNRPNLATDDRKHILELLSASEGFEQFLHTKYVGQKRFSLQGAESLIPLLDTVVQVGGSMGVDDFLMGMSHRGRLNVLAHTLRKPYELILSEFEGTAVLPDDEGDGDVKYHLGYKSERDLVEGRRVGCYLSPNPSHLELVNPVVEGMAKARQDFVQDQTGKKVVPILIHGEAAFTGQGIVHETLSLSELEAYRTGGTIHVIVNNQVGFTATPRETRFTPYPTDVAKMIQAPVFHVNAEDPEAVVHAARLAIEFRQQFKCDVFIDLIGYRKFGHNETDDPTFTQPLMYQIIEQKTSIRDLYAKRLIDEGVVTEAEFEQMKHAVREQLEVSMASAREARPRERMSPFRGPWEGYTRARDNWTAQTAIPLATIQKISALGTEVPPDFVVHPKLKRLLAMRQEMAAGDKPVDWGCAEMWAFGSLLSEGTSLRLTGQDSERGTFSHRHAVLHHYETGVKYAPLSAARKDSSLTIRNTMLSELAVLGFEYGYSTFDPRTLVIWEAQFGDFVNGAQAILDQFLASAESKWDRMSGLVLLLPHGYEGQGPEHSSARLERFLQLCAENNMQVCYPTVPSQYFHVLRRQIHRKFRKPLVMMMPKSMLRDERSTSRLSEFTGGSFQVVLDDPAVEDADNVERVLFCSGKVYFTLSSARNEVGTDRVGIVRVEQLYPFPEKELSEVLARYPHAHEFFWVQEEPKNMGAWSFVEPRIRKFLPEGAQLQYRGRGEAASPAHGFYRVHQLEEQEFVKASLDVPEDKARSGKSGTSEGKAKLKEQHGN